LFLRLVVRVKICLLWCVVGVVGAASERIDLPHLYSHTGDDLYGGVSEVMATCTVRLLVVLHIWRDLFLRVSLAFAGGRGEVVSLEQGCWSGGGGSIVFLRLRRWETAGLGPR
jgi:hypothetical protein